MLCSCKSGGGSVLSGWIWSSSGLHISDNVDWASTLVGGSIIRVGPGLSVGIVNLMDGHSSGVSVWFNIGSVSEMELLIIRIIVWIGPLVAWWLLVHLWMVSTVLWVLLEDLSGSVGGSTSRPVFAHTRFLSSSESSSWVGWWGRPGWGSSRWSDKLDKVNWLFSFSLDNEFIEHVASIIICSVKVDGDSSSDQAKIGSNERCLRVRM